MAAVTRYDPEAKKPVMWRGLLLYFLPLPLLPAIFSALSGGETVVALARVFAFAAAMTAATLIRKGIRLDNETKRRNLRRRASTVRYRVIGATILAIGMFVLAWIGIPEKHGLFDSIPVSYTHLTLPTIYSV